MVPHQWSGKSFDLEVMIILVLMTSKDTLWKRDVL